MPHIPSAASPTCHGDTARAAHHSSQLGRNRTESKAKRVERSQLNREAPRRFISFSSQLLDVSLAHTEHSLHHDASADRNQGGRERTSCSHLVHGSPRSSRQHKLTRGLTPLTRLNETTSININRKPDILSVLVTGPVTSSCSSSLGPQRHRSLQQERRFLAGASAGLVRCPGREVSCQSGGGVRKKSPRG